MTRFFAAAALVTALPGLSRTLAAQGQVSVVAGPSVYDLSGTGTTYAINAGLAFRPLDRILVVEPSFGFLRYTTQGDIKATLLMPELSLQAEARLGPVRPYLGGGAGQVRASGGGFREWDTSLHGLAGVRAELGAGWGARAELRVRAIGPTGGTTADFGVGLARRVF